MGFWKVDLIHCTELKREVRGYYINSLELNKDKNMGQNIKTKQKLGSLYKEYGIRKKEKDGQEKTLLNGKRYRATCLPTMQLENMKI